MAEDTTNVNPAALIVDCSSISAFAKDLKPGDMARKHSEQEGIELVIEELHKSQEIGGRKAGITDAEIQAIDLDTQRIAEVEARQLEVDKLQEILRETKVDLIDQRHRRISAIASLVDVRADKYGETDLLAQYAKTRAYRSANAVKAVKTRRKNAEAKAKAKAQAKDGAAAPSKQAE